MKKYAGDRWQEMRFYYCAASPFRVNPRIHTVELTLPFMVRNEEQPLDGTLKELAFCITKHTTLPNAVLYNEKNGLKTDKSRAEASC